MTHQHARETLAAERYLLDEMPEIERYSFEEHFFECEDCAEDMRLGNRLRTDARRIFTASSSNPAASSPASSWRRPAASIALPWAAAAVLALALFAQMRTPPPLVGETGARAYEPVALRPVSRGAMSVVPLPATGEHAALALEVNIGAPGAPIAYTLTRDDGTAVLSGRAMVPDAGVPLLLLVPGERVVAGGSYVLTLTASGDAAARPAAYRFGVAVR
jgi:hypothetical protein